MAGSPRYLQLLDHVRASLVPIRIGHTDWEYLDQRWYHLTQSQAPYNLEELATVAFQILARETNTSLDKVMEAAEELHIAKNAGYAGADNPDPWANFRMATIFGSTPFQGCMIRLGDKYIRTVNLRANPTNERVGESIFETLRDLGAYALIGVCLLEEERQET